MYYNNGMILQRISAAPPNAEGFGGAVRVQGGTLRTRGGDRLVESGGRFKLDCAGSARLFILSGEGQFKWARGETPFSAGDAFLLEGTGECDLYGICAFLLARE